MSLLDIAQSHTDSSAGVTGTGGSFETPREGIALLRMCSYIEFGLFETEWQGKKKTQRKVMVEFELLHDDHKIKGTDGSFKGYHRISIRLSKSNFEKSNYMKVFNKLNYKGTVHVAKGSTPNLSVFLGEPYLGQVVHNVNGDKTYANLSKDGEYFINPPRMDVFDPNTGMPTGKTKEIDIPMLNTDIRLFLWEEPSVSNAEYHEMWDSIYIEGEKEDGTSRNWIQNQILSPENLELPGSRAEGLFIEKGALGGITVENTELLDQLGN